MNQFSVEPKSPETKALPLDIASVAETVRRADQALDRNVPLPRPDEVAALTPDLEAHLALLLEETAPLIDRLDHGSTDWYRKATTHAAALRLTEPAKTGGLTAATNRLRELARSCEWLLGILTEARADHPH